VPRRVEEKMAGPTENCNFRRAAVFWWYKTGISGLRDGYGNSIRASVRGRAGD